MPSQKDPVTPSFLIPQDGPKINVIISQSQAQLANQGYTYNELGLTYNQVGVQYGGIYNTNQDVIPTISMATNIRPSVFAFSDIYTQKVTPPANSGMLMGIL